MIIIIKNYTYKLKNKFKLIVIYQSKSMDNAIRASESVTNLYHLMLNLLACITYKNVIIYERHDFRKKNLLDNSY